MFANQKLPTSKHTPPPRLPGWGGVWSLVAKYGSTGTSPRGSPVVSAVFIPHSELRTPMTWPIATVLLGTLGTVAVALIKWVPRRNGVPVYASLVEMTEIRTRLDSLERSHTQLRTELRADIKELERTLRDLLPSA
jgi:hypothetical protein